MFKFLSKKSSQEPALVIGLDVGGTHTDVVLLGNEGIIREIKVPTDHSDLFQTVLAGLESITEGVQIEDISRAVLSTTLTTNAIVQDKISSVGMIVSSGPGIDPECYRTHEHYFTVSGAIDHRGRETEPVSKNEISEISKFFKQQNIRNVGVVGKFSVRNPDHERKISSWLKSDFDNVFLGHQVSGNLNFARRIATTYLNAAVYPIHKDFFDAVKKSLRKKGLAIPIHVLKADGGTMSLEASMAFPGQTILSGPAASVMGSVAFAAEDETVIVLDIGGTTTDIAVLIDRVPVLDPVGIRLGKFRTLIRSLKTRSIGIGGDSAVRVRDGRLQVGPDRFGPAMAHGGSYPTPTDALSVLGMIREGNRDQARGGIQPIADELGLPVEAAAAEIFDHACNVILDEINDMVQRLNAKPVYTIHELQEGVQVIPQKILLIGGPAPYFARRLEELSGFQVGVVPRWEVANAIGAALARTTCEVTIFADTQLGILVAPEENFTQQIGNNFVRKDANEKVFDLLRKKALAQGARPDDLEMELLEEMEFNMVRGFQTTGKNIRVKAQVQPGLISEYDTIADRLSG